MTFLVGLCGVAGSGKDEVGRILSSRHRCAIISFAGPLYAAISEFTGLSPAELKDRSRKEETIEWVGKSPRELLQSLGTEWGRGMVRSDIWVRIGMRRAAECIENGWGVAITDVRFENEAEAIREAGGEVWMVARDSAGLQGATGSHSSEAGIPGRLVDAVIENNGSLDDLAAAVDAAAASLQTRTMKESSQ